MCLVERCTLTYYQCKSTAWYSTSLSLLRKEGVKR